MGEAGRKNLGLYYSEWAFLEKLLLRGEKLVFPCGLLRGGLSEKFWPHFLAFGGQIFPTDAGGKTPLTERGIPEWEQEKWLCGDLALGKTS